MFAWRRVAVSVGRFSVSCAALCVVVSARPAHAGQVELRYRVALRGVAAAQSAPFAAAVAAVYADPRGWSLGGKIVFDQVARGGDFTVWLAAADEMRSFSDECTASWSCRVGSAIVINQTRWLTGSPYWSGALEEYRAMLINHETGHFLGLNHAACAGAGLLAPVMMQQSKGPQPCKPNAWPLPAERAKVAKLLGLSGDP